MVHVVSGDFFNVEGDEAGWWLSYEKWDYGAAWGYWDFGYYSTVFVTFFRRSCVLDVYFRSLVY